MDATEDDRVREVKPIDQLHAGESYSQNLPNSQLLTDHTEAESQQPRSVSLPF